MTGEGYTAYMTGGVNIKKSLGVCDAGDVGGRKVKKSVKKFFVRAAYAFLGREQPQFITPCGGAVVILNENGTTTPANEAWPWQKSYHPPIVECDEEGIEEEIEESRNFFLNLLAEENAKTAAFISAGR
jgi:hypothetical protein